MTPEYVNRIRGETVTVEHEMIPVGRAVPAEYGAHPRIEQPARRDLRVTRTRTLSERLFTRPWRPFHHLHVWRWVDVQDVDIEGDGDGLEIHVNDGERPAEQLRIDPHAFILDLGFILVALLGGIYVGWVWEPWTAALAALLP